MSADNKPPEMKKKKVEIFHRINRLQAKAGAAPGEDGDGFLDEDKIAEAQQAIADRREECIKNIRSIMGELEKSWAEMKAADIKKRNKFLEKIFNLANQIKDMASTYEYDLMRHFGESLRDFCKVFNTEKQEHLVIVQAHINAMRMSLNENLNDQDTKATELKRMVAVAIEQHS